MVNRPSRKARSDQEALLEGWEWLEGPASGPRVDGRPSRLAGNDPEGLLEALNNRETLPEGREWSGGHP